MRAIDADALVAKCGNWYCEEGTEEGFIGDIKHLIDAQPTIASERKRGRWVEIGDEPYDEWECDVCGFVIDGSGCVDPEEYRDVYHYCPNCGAVMREDES